MNEKWDYKMIVFEFNDDFDEGMQKLKEAGQQGWEAVGMSESRTAFSVLLKRRLSN